MEKQENFKRKMLEKYTHRHIGRICVFRLHFRGRSSTLSFKNKMKFLGRRGKCQKKKLIFDSSLGRRLATPDLIDYSLDHFYYEKACFFLTIFHDLIIIILYYQQT
jgi:hypothetical protein